MWFLIWWLVLAMCVGFFAESRGRSGFGFCLLSAILSPLIGLVIVLIMSDKKKERAIEDRRRMDHERQLESIRAIATANANLREPPVAAPSSIADEIIKLGNLREQGILTDEEFQRQKTIVLSRT